MIKPHSLAKLKNVKVQTVYRWVREGKIPKEKIRLVKREVFRIEIDESVLINELKDYPKKQKYGEKRFTTTSIS